MIKVRSIFLLMTTNIGTALVVTRVLGNGENVSEKHTIFEVFNTAKVVPFLFIFLFLILLTVVYILFKIRKESVKPVNDVSNNMASNRVAKMKEYYHLENLRREEQIFLEVKNYAIQIMAPYMSVDNIEFLCANVECWTKHKGIDLKPLDVSSILTCLDLRHFAWNIGERLGWSGQQRAQFIKLTFPINLKDLEVETIRRNLRQKGTCLIPIDIPEHGEFHFHI